MGWKIHNLEEPSLWFVYFIYSRDCFILAVTYNLLLHCDIIQLHHNASTKLQVHNICPYTCICLFNKPLNMTCTVVTCTGHENAGFRERSLISLAVPRISWFQRALITIVTTLTMTHTGNGKSRFQWNVLKIIHVRVTQSLLRFFRLLRLAQKGLEQTEIEVHCVTVKWLQWDQQKVTKLSVDISLRTLNSGSGNWIHGIGSRSSQSILLKMINTISFCFVNQLVLRNILFRQQITSIINNYLEHLKTETKIIATVMICFVIWMLGMVLDDRI